MKGVTYDLRRDGANSDRYYEDAALFTDTVQLEGNKRLNYLLDQYSAFNASKGIKPHSSREELLLELLLLGTLGILYGAEAEGLSASKYRLMLQITKQRNKSKRFRPLMNSLKGVGATLMLSGKGHSDTSAKSSDLSKAEGLVRWLEASGEFIYEVRRLKGWLQYFKLTTEEIRVKGLADIFKFAKWFEAKSHQALGEYTVRIDTYLKDINNKRKWREDIIFCQRRRVEYHLNMVGAELMNRAFKADFQATSNKVLALPICITSPSGGNCRSQSFGKDFACRGCSASCMVNQLTSMGNENSFSVMVVPHQSSIASSASQNEMFEANTGVIGVACVINLISGGWMLKDMGVAAQCVLLEYSGCRAHWHDKGIPSCININQLLYILGLESRAAEKS